MTIQEHVQRMWSREEDSLKWVVQLVDAVDDTACPTTQPYTVVLQLRDQDQAMLLGIIGRRMLECPEHDMLRLEVHMGDGTVLRTHNPGQPPDTGWVRMVSTDNSRLLVCDGYWSLAGLIGTKSLAPHMGEYTWLVGELPDTVRDQLPAWLEFQQWRQNQPDGRAADESDWILDCNKAGVAQEDSYGPQGQQGGFTDEDSFVNFVRAFTNMDFSHR